MKKVHSLIDLFFENAEIIHIFENFKQFTITTQSVNIKAINQAKLNENIINFPARDSLLIELFLDDHYFCSFLNGDDINIFLSDIQRSIDLREDDSIFKIKITINKNIDINHQLSIYSSETIFDYLSSLRLNGLLYTFKEIINYNNFVIFRLQDLSDYFYTSAFYFCNEEINLDNINIDRAKLINKRNEICSFNNASDYDFLPDDFDLIKKSVKDKINLLMSKITFILSLVFISNTTRIEDDKFYYRICGYKNLDSHMDFNCIRPNYIFFKIYKWIYNQGNISDKVALARNIITLHAKNDLLHVDSGTYDSIKSNFEIYLKENVRNYLEIKNKISQLLFDMSSKTSAIIESFTKTFKNNLLALITFYITIVIRALITGDVNNIFSKEIIYIAYGLSGISFIVLLAMIWEVNMDINRFKEIYYRLKSRYNDILDENDINNIFNNDIDHEKDISFITHKVKVYSIMWVAILLINLIVLFTIANQEAGSSSFQPQAVTSDSQSTTIDSQINITNH